MSLSIFGKTVSGRPTQFGVIFPPDEAWLARQHVEDVLLPDLPIIDAHHHIFDGSQFRYTAADYAKDLATGHTVVGSVFSECRTMYRVGGPEHLLAVGETEFVVGLDAIGHSGLREAHKIQGIVGFADLTLGFAVEEVVAAHLQAGRGLFKGIRFATSWDANPDIINNHLPNGRPGLLTDRDVLDGLRVLARLKLSFDAWVFFTQLDEVASVADAVPDLRIVLDHCGGVLGYGPYANQREVVRQSWASRICEVARRPNVFCKLGGLLHRGAAFDYVHAATPPSSEQLADAWRPYIETCIEAFGPERCMFESNFPVEKMGTGWTTLWNTFKRIAGGASDDERRCLFAGNARRIYGLED